MTKQEITNLIESLITDNDKGQITAEVMRNVLKNINEGTYDGYVYISAAMPNTLPIALKGDEKVFYIAVREGEYSNFNISGTISELSIIRTIKGSWVVESLGMPFFALSDEMGESDRKIMTQKKVTELYNEGYKYAGVAHTNDKVEPLNGKKKVFMFILNGGTYANYGISTEITDFSVIMSIGTRWFVESLGIPFELHSQLAKQEQFNERFAESLETMNKAIKDTYDNLQTKIELLTEGDTSTAIESLKEIVAFFAGINDAETLSGILKALELSLKAEIAKHLPLDGGTMKGNINMDGKRIDNIGLEEVSSLPTTNLYEGRTVRLKNKTYTFYNGLWLALSDDLRGHANDTHEENFIYQPAAADLSIKDSFADIKKLKGNTVAWNQKFDYSNIINNNLATYDNLTGIFTCTPTNQGFILRTKNLAKINHYHLISCEIKSDNNAKINVWNGTSIPVTVSATSNWQKVTSIVKCTDGARSLGISSNDAINPFEVKNIKAFDLTQMFGEGNEPTIEEFEAMFPNDYYEYNEGELLSFDGKGLKSVGFNQWDEEWKVGAYNTSDGSVINGSGGSLHIRNTNPIKVLPDTGYHFKSPVTLFVFWYNSDMNFISYNQAKDTTYTSPANAAYLNFYQYGNNTYGNDICINISHSGYRNGEYEPYEKFILSFQDGKNISLLTGKLNGEGDSVTIFPDGLRSAGTAYDEIVFDEATGKHKAIKRIGSVDMGTLKWYYISDYDAFSTYNEFPSTTESNAVFKGLSAKYLYKGAYFNVKDKEMGYIFNNNLFVKDSSYTDTDSLKASLQGQILYYQLAEPEVYELDFPINTSYEAYDFGTEEVLYNDDKEVNIPMKASIEYGFNAVDMIRSNYFEIKQLKEKLNEIMIQLTNLTNTQSDVGVE